MISEGKRWLKTLPSKIMVLATAYFIIGVLTLAVNAPPVAITAVWLPAGMALTAILVWGYGVWPGILLGAFATQTVFYLNATGVESLLNTLAISALIGSGAVLQGVVGAYLILRFTGFPRSLYQLRKGKTVLLGGPVSCLVGATIGGTTLWLGTGTSALSLIEQWWSGWLADTLGVLIVMPLVSIWLAEKHRITRHMRFLVFLPVSFAMVLTILAFVNIRSSRNSQIQAEFTRKTQVMAASLANTIESYFDVLYTIKSLFDSSEKVERHEFQVFVQRLFDRHSGIQALEWVPRVTQSQRSFYEAAVRHEGFLKFQITERQGQGQMVPAAQRGEYFPVNYVEPYTGNELALGFDLASNSERLIAINRSRDTGRPTATARLTLVQEHEKQYGVIVFLPVFDFKGEPDTVETRRDALRGFVLGVFRIGEMVASALKAFDPATVMYALFDRTPPQDKQLLWAHHPKLQSNADELLNRSWETKSTYLQFRSNFNMGGRNWTMVFTPTADYLAPYQSWDLWAVLAGGLLFTSILGVLLLTVFGRSTEISEANISLQSEIEERKLVEEELKTKQQQIAKDLEVAAGIQQTLIPRYSPRVESIKVAWMFEPCEQIGGDIFNFQYSGRNHISFYMLDVCGHGVSSALISAAVSQFLQTNYELSKSESEGVRPEAVLNSLNRVFPFERFDSFFTVVYVNVDYVIGRLSYSCAGHPMPILLRSDGALEVLNVHGPVIGASGGRPFQQEEKQLRPGDKIVLYTDGVLDHSNLSGEFFGKHRFYEALQKHGDKPLQMLMESVQKTIKDFAGSARSGDDISMMVIEYV
jgi:serine phosphatase RsbU (regulator of sigma subunit)/integral membrane sensor domain MASE1